MAKKWGNWPLKAVLGACVVGLIGTSIVPMLSGIPKGASAPKPDAAAAVPDAKRQELLEQAKGFELVLQREPTNLTALQNLIEIKLELGEVDAAIAPLKKLAELSPENPDYQVLLAQVQQQTGDREAAAQTYRTLIEKQPGNLKALQSLAALLMQENRPTAAVSLLQDTLKLAPEANQAQPGNIDESAIKLMLGEVYTQQNRVDDAIKIYDEVQAENAEDFRPVLAKAMVFKNQGRDAGEYEPLFENAVALAPDRYKDQIEQLAKGPVTAPVGSKAEADAVKATAEATEKNGAAEKSVGAGASGDVPAGAEPSEGAAGGEKLP